VFERLKRPQPSLTEELLGELTADIATQDIWTARAVRVRRIARGSADEPAIHDLNLHATLGGKETDLLFRFVTLEAGGVLDYLYITALDGTRQSILVFDGTNHHVIYHVSQNATGDMQVAVDMRDVFTNDPGLALQASAR